MTFRSGTDVNMDIGISGFGPESAIDRAMVMVSVISKGLFEGCYFCCFIQNKNKTKNTFYKE